MKGRLMVVVRNEWPMDPRNGLVDVPATDWKAEGWSGHGYGVDGEYQSSAVLAEETRPQVISAAVSKVEAYLDG